MILKWPPFVAYLALLLELECACFVLEVSAFLGLQRDRLGRYLLLMGVRVYRERCYIGELSLVESLLAYEGGKIRAERAVDRQHLRLFLQYCAGRQSFWICLFIRQDRRKGHQGGYDGRLDLANPQVPQFRHSSVVSG